VIAQKAAIAEIRWVAEGHDHIVEKEEGECPVVNAERGERWQNVVVQDQVEEVDVNNPHRRTNGLLFRDPRQARSDCVGLNVLLPTVVVMIPCALTAVPTVWVLITMGTT